MNHRPHGRPRTDGRSRRPGLWLQRTAAVVALVATGCAGAGNKAALNRLLPLDEGQRSRILALGPWPPPPARDPGNPVAGQPAAVALGQRLFFDPRLSPDGRLACASCHLPGQAFADGQARSHGREPLARNAPSLWNAVHERWLGWDGAADSLWGQALRPLTDARELASHAPHLRQLFTQDRDLACRFRQTFGQGPMADDTALLVATAQVLGAFVGSLVSGPTAFDRFRDALARGDLRSAARYPLAAQRGLQLFTGRGRCHLCHGGPRLSHGEFADIGAGFFVRPGEVDPGRQGGLAALLSSPFNLLGPHAVAAGDAATKTRHVLPQHRHFGEFKVPGLRNVALTAPYLHDGQLRTLDDVLQHYSALDLDRLHADGERILEPLHLSTAEKADLAAFLHSLSDPLARAWKPRPAPPCSL